MILAIYGAGGRRTIVAPAETAARSPRRLTVGFQFPATATPSSPGIGDETRRLGMYLGYLSVKVRE